MAAAAGAFELEEFLEALDELQQPLGADWHPLVQSEDLNIHQRLKEVAARPPEGGEAAARRASLPAGTEKLQPRKPGAGRVYGAGRGERGSMSPAHCSAPGPRAGRSAGSKARRATGLLDVSYRVQKRVRWFLAPSSCLQGMWTLPVWWTPAVCVWGGEVY